MNDTDVTALIAGGAAGGGTLGYGLLKRRREKKQERIRQMAVRLFPKADPKKLDREVQNLLRHKRVK